VPQGELKRFHFLTEDRRTVICIIDESFFNVLRTCVHEIGPCSYFGHNSPDEPPMEHPDRVKEGKKKNWQLIPFQGSLLGDVDQ
jgi:hypothetical protein